MSFQQSERRKVQEKLDKLLAFAAASANVFEGANSLGDVAAQGGAAIQVSLNAGNYNIPTDMSWAATTQTNWAAREQAIVDNYETALAKVQNGEELTPEDVTAIERYQAAYPDKVNQEAVKAAEAYRVDSRYQAAVSKVNNGQELSKSDVQAIEAYQKAHPDAKIDKKLLEAVKAANEKADIETTNSAKELSKQAGISYEDAYNFIVNGVLSDESKEKLDQIENVEKFTKTLKNAAYISSSFRYWLKHKDEWTDEMFKARTFSKSGARIEDVKYVGKYLKKSKTLTKIASKLPSYEHGRLNRDLKMMKENQIVSKLGKVGKVAGKGLKVAGWVGVAFDAKDAVQDYKKKGYSNEQTAALATRKVAVDMAASAVGSTAGRVAGAAVGQILIPIPGVGAAIGSVAGSIVGGWLGSKVGDAVNTQLDKNVKPKKSGWSWPW